jgi:MFS family permease
MRRSPLLPIFLIVLVDVLALTIMIPLLPFYAEHYGASALTVGLLATSFSLCQLISGPILGNLSDRYGRRPLLIVSQIGTLAGLLLLAWADQLWLIFVARLLDGATAGNLSIAQAYVSDVTRPEQRAKAFGLIGIAFGVGFVIGPLLTSALAPFGYAVPVLGAAALSATSVACTYFLLPRDPPRPDGEAAAPASERKLGVLSWGVYAAYLRRPGLAPLMLQFLLFSVAFALFMTGFPLFAERRFTWDGRAFGAREVSLVYVYVGAIGIVLQGGLLGRLVKRFGERRLVIAGFLLAGAAYLGFAVALAVAALIACAGVAAVGNGLVRPSLTSEVTQAVGRHEQGTVLGMTQALWSIGAIVAPPIGTGLIGAGALGAWAAATGVISLIGFAIAATRRRPLSPVIEPA